MSSVCNHPRCKFGPHNLLKQGASASVHQCIVAAIIQIVPVFLVVSAFREFGFQSLKFSGCSGHCKETGKPTEQFAIVEGYESSIKFRVLREIVENQNRKFKKIMCVPRPLSSMPNLHDPSPFSMSTAFKKQSVHRERTVRLEVSTT